MSNERKRFAELMAASSGLRCLWLQCLEEFLFWLLWGCGQQKNFWSAGYLAVLVGFLVYKDKKEFQKALIDGIRDNIFAFMIACFLLAGVMSKF